MDLVCIGGMAMRKNFKFASFISILLSFLLLAACSAPSLNTLMSQDYQEYADQRAAEIVAALQSQDLLGLTAMFSASTIRNDETLSIRLPNYTTIFQGNVISMEGNYSTEGAHRGNHKTVDLSCQFYVETDQGTYFLVFIERIIDTNQPDEIGLSKLYLYKYAES